MKTTTIVHRVYLAYNRLLNEWQWTFETMTTILDTYTFSTKEEAVIEREKKLKEINNG